MFRHRNELPVEGVLPGFDGATAWLNSGPLTPAGLRGQVVLVSFGTYTCINWIRSLPYVRAWADGYAGRGLTVVGVQTPEFEFEGDVEQRGPRHQGDGRPLPGRRGQRLRRLAGVRQPLLARSVLRRCPGSHPAPPLRRRRLRAIRDGPPDAVARGRCRRRTGPRAHRAPRCRGRRRLGQPGIAGKLCRLRARRGPRLARRCRARPASPLLGADRVAPQPLGAVRRLADRLGARAAQRARRLHLVPVPRS